MSFQNTSNKILVNLKTEKEKVFELINNQEQNDYTKQKRSLPNKIGEIVNILFGEINLRDAYKLYSDIKSMIKNGKKSQNSVDNKLIITPANTNEAVVTNPTMTEASIEIQNNVRRIHHHTNNNGEEFSDEQMEEILKNQIFQLNIQFNQYMMELGRIIDILHTAIQGKLHQLVVSQNQMLEELRSIKLNLPTDLDIPVKLDVSGVSEIFKIMQTTVVKSNNLIIFISTIPLVSSNSYNLYNVLPNPILVEDNTFMLIKLRIKF